MLDSIRAVVVSAVCLLAATAVAAQKTPQQLFDDARAAYQQKDYPAYAAAMDALAQIRPSNPIVLINRAGALSLAGRPGEAFAQLGALGDRWIAVDLSDHDFDPIRGRPEFAAVEERMRRIARQEIGRGAIAHRIPSGDLLTEAIVYDAARHRFLVSCDRARKIISIDAKGRVSDFVPAADHGLWGGNGLGIDAARGLLWVDSSASEVGTGYDPAHAGEAALFAYRLSDGAFVSKFDAPKDGSRHFLDDLTVGRDGTVYVSDSSGMMFRLPQGGDALEVLVPRGMIRSPQGSALSRDGRLLYVADYAGGIAVVDLVTGDVAHIAVPVDFPAYGVDGLAFHDGWLIAVQNGVNPNRVVALRLAPGGTAVESWKILEMNHPLMDEPTIGVVARGAYYWLGASQRNKLEANPPKMSEVHDAVIYRTALP